jgi:hypothetical protein
MKVLAPTGNQVIKIAARESGTYTLNIQLTNKNTNKLDVNAENIDGEDAVFNNGFLEITLPIQDDFARVLKEGTFYSMVVYRTDVSPTRVVYKDLVFVTSQTDYPKYSVNQSEYNTENSFDNEFVVI